MAFGQVAGLSDALEDYAGYFLKFYEQGVTTPLSMATDATGGTLLAKAEISSGGTVPIGFIKTAGDAIFIPYVDQAYDAFLFPTAAEADANDLTDAIQIADDVTGMATTEDIDNVIAKTRRSFATVSAMVADTDLSLNQLVSVDDYAAGNGSGVLFFKVVTAGTGTANLGRFIDLPNTTPARQAEGVFSEGEVTAKHFSAAGSGDDTAAFTAMEAESFDSVDLVEGSYSITLDAATLTKNYFNGSITAADEEIVKQLVPDSDYSVLRPRTKSHFLDWDGTDVLWLGTSIPAEGGTDSYPDRFGKILNCTVTNNSFAGSHANYDFNGNAFDIDTVKALSMTQADVDAGIATHGTSSAYDDSFDPITKASQMTADFRIKNAFEVSDKAVVFLDHNHNDRLTAPGTLSPAKQTITGVTIGSTTGATVADASSFTVGDAAAMEIVGIADLNFATGRISAIAAGLVTIEYDSTGFTGTFTSGDLVPLDRATLFGAFNFLIYFIKNLSVINGTGDVVIVLSGAPSEHTNNVVYDPSIFSSAEQIKKMANKWDLPFFDIGYIYDIKFEDHLIYFPDGVHPTTAASRMPITNQWVRWAIGGLTGQVDHDDFLPAGATNFNDQREALFDVASAGFITPNVIYTDGSILVDDDFTGGLGGWTLAGTIIPVIVSPSPWDAGEDSVFCEATAGNPSKLTDSDSYGDDVDLEFDLYMPVVSGLIGAGDPVGIVNICEVRSTGAAYNIQLIVRETSVTMRANYFKSPNVDLVNLPSLDFVFAAATRYKIRWVIKKSDSSSIPDGKMEIYIDNTLNFTAGDNDTFSQTAIASYGLQSSIVSNVTAFDCYFGNAKATLLTSNDYTQRFTGTFIDNTTAVVTVVNGIIVTKV